MFVTKSHYKISTLLK